jgi:hypothetical protein
VLVTVTYRYLHLSGDECVRQKSGHTTTKLNGEPVTTRLLLELKRAIATEGNVPPITCTAGRETQLYWQRSENIIRGLPIQPYNLQHYLAFSGTEY